MTSPPVFPLLHSTAPGPLRTWKLLPPLSTPSPVPPAPNARACGSVSVPSLCEFLCFVCLFGFLDSTDGWNQTVSVFLCLIYFRQHGNFRSVDAVAMASSGPFSWPSNIPPDTHHLFFTHALRDGLLGRSHVLAAVNNVASTGVPVSLWVSVFVSLR